MTLGLLCLLVEVVQTDVILHLSEDLVLLGCTKLCLLSLGKLSLGMLFELVR